MVAIFFKARPYAKLTQIFHNLFLNRISGLLPQNMKQNIFGVGVKIFMFMPRNKFYFVERGAKWKILILHFLRAKTKQRVQYPAVCCVIGVRGLLRGLIPFILKLNGLIPKEYETNHIWCRG